MIVLTASGVDRADKCIASVVLPGEDTPSQGKSRGSAIAKFLQRVSEVGGEAALAEVPRDHVEVCASIDLDSLPTNLAAEVSFAYNFVTGEAKELGRGLERDYPDLGPDWMYGTVDVLGVSDDAVYVADHKGYQEVPAAEENLQVGSGAMAFAKIYRKQKAFVEILRPLAGGPRKTSAWLDQFELDAIEAQLRSIHADMIAALALPGQVVPQPGKHCQYCRAAQKGSCPVAGVGMNALEVRQKTGLDPMGQVTRENAADWYRALRAVKAWLDSKNSAVYALAAEVPIDLGNGKTLGMTEKTGIEKLDPVVTYTVLLGILGERIANDAMERVAVKKKLDAALKAHEVPNRTAVAKKVWEEVRARGGSWRSVKREVGEF